MTISNRKCGNCCFFKRTDAIYGECAINKHKTVNQDNSGDRDICKHHLYMENATYEHNANKITL